MTELFSSADPAITSLLARFGIDIVAMAMLVFGLYYRRYRDKQLVTTAALFNVFVFAVMAVLSSVEFSLAAGFGLFAILALFTLRSEPIDKIEITYFFGSVALAVICAVAGTSLAMTATIAAIVIVGAWAFDHPRVLPSADGIRVNLDRIDPRALSDPGAMREELSRRLGVDVMSYQIVSLDFITDMARINVHYRKPTAAARRQLQDNLARTDERPSGDARTA